MSFTPIICCARTANAGWRTDECYTAYGGGSRWPLHASDRLSTIPAAPDRIRTRMIVNSTALSETQGLSQCQLYGEARHLALYLLRSRCH